MSRVSRRSRSRSRSLSRKRSPSLRAARKQFGGEAFMTTQRFDELPLKPMLLKSLKDVFQYERMSQPQAMAIPVALAGKDVLLRSSTGSGKTLTFLLAGLQRHLSSKMSPGSLGVLVLTPLREVALQTQGEADKLLQFLPSRGAQVVIGGTDMGREKRALASKPCDVLVATPGRLLDHMKTNAVFAEQMKHVHTVVIDETDRMLDAGFINDVRKIFAGLPPREERQAILVSATIDERVQQLAKTFLRTDFAFLSTVVATENHQVNDRIDLRMMQVEPGQILFALEQALIRDPKKTLVFMPASNWASFTAQLLRAAGHTQVEEFHGKLNQSQRTRTIQKFTKDPQGVLIASDAAARGLDITDIDRVIQIGLTDVAGFVQRSGRTARAGRQGEALWLLGTDESNILKEFAKVPLKPLDTPLPTTPSPAMAEVLRRMRTHADLQRALRRAFVGTLGTYAAPRKRLGWDAQKVVDAVKARFASVGLTSTPSVESKTLKKMNLANVVL